MSPMTLSKKNVTYDLIDFRPEEFLKFEDIALCAWFKSICIMAHVI